VFGGTALGFFIGNFWLMSLGVAYTLAFAPVVKSMPAAGAGRGRPGDSVAADSAGRVGNAFADIHSAAVSSGMLLR
jgi:NCS1 family nucleobase:cation symporter-1